VPTGNIVVWQASKEGDGLDLPQEKTQMSLRVYLFPTKYAASPSGMLLILRSDARRSFSTWYRRLVSVW
jgi:hypothetical protein